MYLLFDKRYVEGLSEPLDNPLIAQTKRVLNKYGIDPKDWSIYFRYLTELLKTKEQFGGDELLKRLGAITKSYEIIGANPDVLNEIAYFVDLNVDKAYELLDDEDTALAKVLLKIAWQYRNWIDKDSWNKIAEYYDKTPYYAYLSVYTEILKHKPVLFLAFDEGIGNIAHNLSFNENNGTIYGATWRKLKTGKNALFFDGVDDYVEVPDSDRFNWRGSLTLMAWINVKGLYSSGDASFILSKHDWVDRDGDTITNVWGFWLDVYRGKVEGRVLFVIGDGYKHGIIEISDAGWRLNNWFHLVAVAKYNPDTDTSTLRIYKDGVLLRETEVDAVYENIAKHLAIGRVHWYNNNNQFKGIIAHISIYNRALSKSEIKKIYETTKVLFD